MTLVIHLVVTLWSLVSLLGLAACVVAGRADARAAALEREVADHQRLPAALARAAAS